MHLDIRVNLDGEVADRFMKIKGILGVRADTEVIRNIINDYFQTQYARQLKKLKENGLS